MLQVSSRTSISSVSRRRVEPKGRISKQAKGAKGWAAMPSDARTS
jgi:hypothetical protein